MTRRLYTLSRNAQLGSRKGVFFPCEKSADVKIALSPLHSGAASVRRALVLDQGAENVLADTLAKEGCAMEISVEEREMPPIGMGRGDICERVGSMRLEPIDSRSWRTFETTNLRNAGAESWKRLVARTPHNFLYHLRLARSVTALWRWLKLDTGMERRHVVEPLR